ncbi:unnamed protein product [Closterium sp. NIES-53]
MEGVEFESYTIGAPPLRRLGTNSHPIGVPVMGRSHLLGNNVIPPRAPRSQMEAVPAGSMGRMGHRMQSSGVMRRDQVEVVEREGTHRTVQLPRPSNVPTLFDPSPREYTEEDKDRLSRKMVGAAVDKAFTTTPFDGTNFREWALRFRMNARVTNLWEFFVTLQYPVTMANGDMRDAMERLEVLQADYSQRATLAFWVLLHSVSATIQLQLDVFQESYSLAFEAWEYLMETYQAKDSVAKASLQRQLDNLEMGSQERVEEYINRATAICDKLAMAGKMVDEDSFTLNLITGLPPHWEELRHSAMLHDISDSYTLQQMMIQEQRYQDLISKANHDKRPPRMAGQARSMWLLDSGCSQHMTSEKDWFEGVEELNEPVYVELADGSHLLSSMAGKIRETAPDGTTVRFTDVLYVPGLKSNLLSYCQLHKKGARIRTRDDGNIEITMAAGDEHVVIGIGMIMHDVLMMQYEPALTSARESGHDHPNEASNEPGLGGLNVQSAHASITYCMAHKRLGHPSYTSMDATFRNGDVEGLSISDKTSPLKPPCDSCLRGKISKTPFPTGGDKRTTRPLELVHSDIMDLGDAHPSLRYVLTLKDDYTNYLWVAPLARRSDMATVFSAWHREMKTKLPTKPLAALRTDNGGEYTANAFTDYLSSHGINHQTSLPHTPQQNGVAERVNRTLMNRVRAMTTGASLSSKVFNYLQNTADMGLVYGGGDLVLRGYTDSDYANEEGRHSVGGYVFTLGGAAVSWKTKRQTVIATYTAEAEYIALFEGAREATYLRRLCEDLGFRQQDPTVIFVDNQSAIALATGEQMSQRIKHMDIRYHWTRKAVRDGVVWPEYCPTAQQAADYLTKPLTSKQHLTCSLLCGLQPTPHVAPSAPSTPIEAVGAALSSPGFSKGTEQHSIT